MWPLPNAAESHRFENIRAARRKQPLMVIIKVYSTNKGWAASGIIQTEGIFKVFLCVQGRTKQLGLLFTRIFNFHSEHLNITNFLSPE